MKEPLASARGSGRRLLARAVQPASFEMSL